MATIRAHFDGQAFIPDEPVDCETGAAVRLTIEPTAEQPDVSSSLFRAAERARPTGIHDLAINHDHYLYGHPKVSDA